MFDNLFKSSTQGRKYVDLLFEVTGQYANWEPTKSFQVGDYGYVDKQSGLFTREGSVWDNKFREQYGIVIAAAKTNPRERQMTIMSHNGRKLDLPENAHVPMGFVDGSFSLSVQFTKHRGALLVLISPQLVSIQNDRSLKDLLSKPELKGKCVVYQAYRCPAYALVLTESRRSSANITFAVKPGAGSNVASDVGLSGGAQWSVDSSSGIMRDGKIKDGEEEYCPLVGLKALGKMVGAIRKDEDRKELPIYEPPWGMLDEDGEEEEDEGEEDEDDE